MFSLKHLRSFCLAGSKKTRQQEFTSHLGASITKSREWQHLIAAKDTISPETAPHKTPECCPCSKGGGGHPLGKEPALHEPAAVAQKGGQEDGHHHPRESPESPVTTAGRQCSTLEAPAHWGELLQRTLLLPKN